MTKDQKYSKEHSEISTEDDLHFNDDSVENEKWWWVFQNPFGLVVIIALCIILSVGLWFVFQTSPAPTQQIVEGSRGVPVISADSAPYKTAPAPEDTSAVENQDKEVFTRLKSKDKLSKPLETKVIESEVEKPLEVHNLPDPLPSTENIKKLTANASNESELKPTTMLSEKESQVAEKTKKQKQKLACANKIKGLMPGLYMVRVASFRKPETADRELQRIVGLLPKELRNTGQEVRRLEADSGVFYIALIGAFPNLAAAKTVVAALKEKNCSVVIQKVSKK